MQSVNFLIFVINPWLLSKLDEISERVGHLPVDLKAETVIAMLAGTGIDIREFLVSFEGQLQRNWSRDIASAAVESFETGDFLVFHLNRDGIYDMLPELLFHNKLDKDSSSAEEMAKDSMQLRLEEKESRTFFQPFENGVFAQGVNLALREQQLYTSILLQNIMGVIPGFWNIPEDLPVEYTHNLVKLIPYASRVAGNFSLTARCLAFILKEKVSVASIPQDGYIDNGTHMSLFGRLGEAHLGSDAICGNLVNGSVARVVFSIGPLQRPVTDRYVKSGVLNHFLDCFYGFFIPVHLDAETRFTFEPSESLFVLASEENPDNSYLGYNTVIP